MRIDENLVLNRKNERNAVRCSENHRTGILLPKQELEHKKEDFGLGGTLVKFLAFGLLAIVMMNFLIKR